MALAISSLLITSFIFIGLAYILVYYLRKLPLYRESARFPGPRAYPFIGSAHLFIGLSTEDILSKCQELLDTYPSPFRAWFAGSLYYAVYDPEQLKTILLSPKTIEKGDIYKFLQPYLGTGLLTAPASKWRIHRKLIAPTFTQKILESFVEVFAVKSEVLVKEMEIEVNGEEFDVFRYISPCTLDIVCETALGVPSNAQTERNSPFIKATNRLMEIIFTRAVKIWLYPDIIFNHTTLGKEHNKYIKVTRQAAYNVIQKKRRALESKGNQRDTNDENDGKRKAFLDLLMELSLEGTKFTDEELREEVDAMMIAGNDTTATVNSFALLMLASYPEIQQKVYEELCEIYGYEDPENRPVRHADLHRMEYLERVIKETMRIFPVGPLLLRHVTDDLNIGKFTLKKGSSVIISIIKTHRSEKYWTDPLKFNPDRFLPEECAKRHPYCYIPFSAGPRNCLGMRFAMMAMKALIATVVRKYLLKKDKVVPIENIKLKADVMLKPSDSIKIKIKKRTYTS